MTEPIIIQLLIDKCIKPHYAYRYHKFISACVRHNETTTHEYTELHHILPKAKAFWPEYSHLRTHKWNGVRLTARQHIIAHWILARALGGSMIDALWIMTNGNSQRRSSRVKIKSRLYDEARRLKAANPFRHTAESKLKLSIALTGAPRIPVTDETRAKMSATATGRKKSDETRANMSKAQTGKSGTRNGATHTDEAKAKISESSKARRVTCPHCNKEGHIGAMTRHHLDNCKFK